MEAVRSYSDYIDMIDLGKIDNTPAPQLAIDYYGLDSNAKLRDMLRRVRDDEKKHSEVNWDYSL